MVTRVFLVCIQWGYDMTDNTLDITMNVSIYIYMYYSGI